MRYPLQNSTHDSGAKLRSLYAAEGGVRAIFSSKVADYAVSRPDYPEALFDALRDHAGLRPGARVVDVGAGTGLLTQGLLHRGATVVAVEPNAAMRAAADHFLGANPNYRSVEGSAESLPLEDGSVDLVTAAHAFHWFEIDAARAECQRALRTGGFVALIWNDRLPGDPLHGALDELLSAFGGPKRAALVAHEDRAGVPRFFGAATAVERTWPHEHHLDEAALASLVFSRSYMPARDSAKGVEAEREVRRLFAGFNAGGRVVVRYTTVAIIGALA